MRLPFRIKHAETREAAGDFGERDVVRFRRENPPLVRLPQMPRDTGREPIDMVVAIFVAPEPA
jgi:hypothetical protein